MSSISNLPYGKILDYWFEKLSDSPYRFKFILTKFVEIHAFKSRKNGTTSQTYIRFPSPIKSHIPSNPKVSIVIPTFIKTEKDMLDINNLLASIKSQTMKPDSVFIVDDCSPTNFEFPSDITVHRLSHNSGPAHARNIGKQLAIDSGADIIAFTDTDCILTIDWIDVISKDFSGNEEFQILSGNTISYDNGWLGTYHNINGTLNGRKFKENERLLYGTTANLAISNEVAKKIEFNENFPTAAGEDIAFCFEANMLGYAIKHIPRMLVYHNFGYNGSFYENLKRFRNQFKRYGQGEQTLLQEIPKYYAYFDMTEEIPTHFSIKDIHFDAHKFPSTNA